MYGVLQEHFKASPTEGLLTAEIGSQVGLKERATQNHLAHLFAHSRIDADRRTPLNGGTFGVSQPALPGAQDWARSVAAPDPTCAKCLVALAGWGWGGEAPDVKELAAAAGVSVRSVERHRPHLIDFNLLEFKPSSIPVGDGRSGKFRGREASRYLLLSGFHARELTEAERATVPERARLIVKRVRWFAGATVDERERAEIAVGFVLRAGWPDEQILRVLDHTADRNAYKSRTGYLHALLSKVRGKRYVIPAQEWFTGQSGPRTAHRDAAEDTRCRTA
ncbi:hypothetical protein [Streptomyces violascens]|uniref:hypothetical protein n=1 Tax=Streptomyces violascens TaxID=67381 RepID=UPI00167BB44E|nr:hypothetical protein [Streptomyces violascens]GGU51170.1 hypothetical protein GCM10010289_84490 [Streptomyces violascens]